MNAVFFPIGQPDDGIHVRDPDMPHQLLLSSVIDGIYPFFGSAATVIGYFNTQNIFLSCDPHKDISFFTLL
jgi:hypothetical protein